MSLQIVKGQNTNTIWYLAKDAGTSNFDSTVNKGYKQLGSFSSTTNWEKVFMLGDKINRNLQLTEKDVLDELSKFRTSKKR